MDKFLHFCMLRGCGDGSAILRQFHGKERKALSCLALHSAAGQEGLLLFRSPTSVGTPGERAEGRGRTRDSAGARLCLQGVGTATLSPAGRMLGKPIMSFRGCGLCLQA